MFKAVSRYMRRRRKEAQLRSELHTYSLRELNDMGITRDDIGRIAREGARD